MTDTLTGDIDRATEIAEDDETALVRDRLDQFFADHDTAAMEAEEYRGALYDAGLAWVSNGVDLGGLDVRPQLQKVIQRRTADEGAPDSDVRLFFGILMAGPVIHTHGADDTKSALLRETFTGETIWCQLFSEPGSGSDLAGLSTKAELDGEEWIVNGQKVWNTGAHLADRGMLVARTDPDVPKHKGLTYFGLDMRAPGVEVRPLRQITGEAEFNEVYMTDVRVPDSDRIGDVGDGWRVAMTTLMNERVGIGGGLTSSSRAGIGPIAEAVRIWKEGGHDDPARLEELMSLWTEAEALRLTNLRAAQNRKSGVPGPEGSIGKLMLAGLNQRIYAFCVDLLGAAAMVDYDYSMTRAAAAESFEGAPGTARRMFLRTRANSIEGGTSEILRNILGERVLGLPGEPRVDKELPWVDVPRN